MAHIEYDFTLCAIHCYGAKDAETAAALMQKDLDAYSKTQGWLYVIDGAVEYCQPRDVYSAFIRPVAPYNAENIKKYANVYWSAKTN